jgi:hypothetical protein
MLRVTYPTEAGIRPTKGSLLQISRHACRHRFLSRCGHSERVGAPVPTCIPFQASWARRHIQAVQRDSAIVEDEEHVSYMADVRKRIAVNNHEVCFIADLN